MSTGFRKPKPKTKEVFIGYNEFGVVMETCLDQPDLPKVDAEALENALKPEKVKWSDIFAQKTE